ncbi:MAG: hypothetical protein PVH61_35810 [Candidatus Aminicenantes bacterium]|jgi:hypothetical protein
MQHKNPAWLSLRCFAGFLGVVENQYFFRWGTTERSPARVQLTEHVGILFIHSILFFLSVGRTTFPPVHNLQWNRLYTFHYDEGEERYKIIRHTLNFLDAGGKK